MPGVRSPGAAQTSSYRNKSTRQMPGTEMMQQRKDGQGGDEKTKLSVQSHEERGNAVKGSRPTRPNPSKVDRRVIWRTRDEQPFAHNACVHKLAQSARRKAPGDTRIVWETALSYLPAAADNALERRGLTQTCRS